MEGEGERRAIRQYGRRARTFGSALGRAEAWGRWGGFPGARGIHATGAPGRSVETPRPFAPGPQHRDVGRPGRPRPDGRTAVLLQPGPRPRTPTCGAIGD